MSRGPEDRDSIEVFSVFPPTVSYLIEAAAAPNMTPRNTSMDEKDFTMNIFISSVFSRLEPFQCSSCTEDKFRTLIIY